MIYKTDQLWLRPNENGTLSVGVLEEFAAEHDVLTVGCDGHSLVLKCKVPEGIRTEFARLPVKGDMVLMYDDIVHGRSNAYYRPGYEIDMTKVTGPIEEDSDGQ